MDEMKEKLIEMLREEHGDEVAFAAAGGEEIFAAHGAGWGDGKLDSLDRMEFIMSVEDAFDVELADEIVVDVRTVDQIAELVDTLTRGPLHGAH